MIGLLGFVANCWSIYVHLLLWMNTENWNLSLNPLILLNLLNTFLYIHILGRLQL